MSDSCETSHYAQKHQGLAIQFETLRDHRVFLRAIRLDYTKTFPRVNFFDDASMQNPRWILSKFEDWRYEKERRIVAPDGASQWLPFRAEALTGLILGARFPEDASETFQSLLEERRKMKSPDVAIYRAKEHPTDYRLTLDPQKRVLEVG